jgi:hypothetical protein
MPFWGRARGGLKNAVRSINRKIYKNKRQQKRLLRCGAIKRWMPDTNTSAGLNV